MAEAGGVAAALGLRYQYLLTIEAAVREWRRGELDLVIHTEDSVHHAVDYSLSGPDGHYVEVVQVKGTGSAAAELSPRAAVETLLQLVTVDSRRYRLATNRQLSPGVRALADTLTAADGLSQAEFARAVRLVLTQSPAGLSLLDGVDESTWSRLTRCRIERDERDLAAVWGDLRDDVLRIRRGGVRGTGPESASLMVNHLIADVFARSARSADRAFTVGDFGRLLQQDGLVVARALGRYDWGRPVGALPRRPAVDRGELVERLAAHFTALELTRTPRRCVLSGLSGIGKSSACADYAHRYAARYDWIVWVDAESDDSIRHRLAHVVGGSTEHLTTDQFTSAVRDHFATSPATWLLVMDNASSGRSLAPWLPTVGHVDVVATSTDGNEWTSWEQVVVGTMSQAEAEALVATRLLGGGVHLADATQHGQVELLATRLERWPLALELACAHLATSGRGLAFTGEYLDELALPALSDPAMRPEGYETHPSLVAAVLHALGALRARGEARGSLAMAALCAMTFLPAREVPTRCAAKAGQMVLDALQGSGTDVAEPVPELLVDRAVQDLGRASLATREVGDPADDSSDTVSTNELVLQVLRQEMPPALARTALLADVVVLDHEVLTRIDAEDYRGVRRLLPSALVAAGHAEALLLDDPPEPEASLATLLGNVSKFHAITGDFDAALGLLRREEALLSHWGGPRTPLHLKVAIASTECSLRASTRVEEVVGEAGKAIAIATEVWDSGRQDVALASSLASLLRDLRSLDGRRPGQTGLRALIRQGEALLDRQPPAERGFPAVSAQADLLLDDGAPDDAVRLLEGALAVENMGPHARGSLSAQLVEAYAQAGRPGDAARQLRSTMEMLDQASLSRRTATTGVLNAWFATVLTALIGPLTGEDREFIDVARSALTEDDLGGPEDVHRHAVLVGTSLALLGGDVAETATALRRAADLRVEHSLLVRSGEVLDGVLVSARRVLALRVAGGGPPLVVAAHRVLPPRSGTGTVALLLSDDGLRRVRSSVADRRVHGRWSVHDDGSALALVDQLGGTAAVLWLPGWPGSLGIAPAPPTTGRTDADVLAAIDPLRSAPPQVLVGSVQDERAGRYDPLVVTGSAVSDHRTPGSG
ncbi:hypothetical protein [Modestobacter sp. SSW1-42]|uniref:hypothetical protein n=1 Tax=Modestobacter sp. SSW1-42 TaxID=596372 RepID=UPI0039886E40